MTVIADIVEKLDSKGIRSYVDSSEQHTPGWKFNQWEMKGVPIRIEIGPKDLDTNSLVIVKRNSRDKKSISINQNPVDQIVKELDVIQDDTDVGIANEVLKGEKKDGNIRILIVHV